MAVRPKAHRNFALGFGATTWAYYCGANWTTHSPTNARKFTSLTRKRRIWKLAGVWYLAGSNRVVYSNPKDELGPAEHQVRTSNRRIRDDEFLISRALTQRRKEIWVRIKFARVNRALYPGYPLAEPPGVKSNTRLAASWCPQTSGKDSRGLLRQPDRPLP
jgi:hypothetical protein